MSFDSSNSSLVSLEKSLQNEGVDACIVDEKNYPVETTKKMIVFGSEKFVEKVLASPPVNLWAVIFSDSGVFNNEMFLRALVNKDVKHNTKVVKNSNKKEALMFMDSAIDSGEYLERTKSISLFAFEELLLNAIYDAPPNKGSEIKDIEVSDYSEKEGVCFSVTDFYGTLDKKSLFSKIATNHKNQIYIPESSTRRAGLGLKQSLNKGVSLKFNSVSNEFTEVFFYLKTPKKHKNQNQSRFIIFNISQKALAKAG